MSESMSREGRIGFLLALVLVFGGLLYLLAPVLTPFLFAALLAYLGDPLADWLEARGLSRTLAVVVVFSVIISGLAVLLLLLLPLLENQVSGLVRRVPGYVDWLQAEALPWLQGRLGLDLGALDLSALKAQLSESLGEVGGAAASFLGSITRSGAAVLGWLLNLLLVPVLTFYLLRDWDLLLARLRELLPRRAEPRVVGLARESNEVLGSFLRGQLLVMLSLGVIYSAGLAAVGLDFSLLIGMGAGLVSFVPYLGSIAGILVAGVAAVVQFQDLLHPILVAAVFGVGQALEGMFLTPLLVGDRVGLHPVAVIFAVLAGGHLFGFFGVLLALPAAAVIMVLLRHTHDEYLKSWLYRE